MCAEYVTRTSAKQIADALGERIINDTGETQWDRVVKLTTRAPVVTFKEGQPRLELLTFPIIPNQNARMSGLDEKAPDQIKRVYERPTWKKAFLEHRALVPMTSFREPAYWGEDAGRIMEFSSPKDPVLFVPAILVTPRKPEGPLLSAFSLLTHTPSTQMLKYHHRLLMFLRPDHAVAWASGGKTADGLEKFNFLAKHRYTPKLNVVIAREMAAGWKKRINAHLEDLDAEKVYMERLGQEEVIG